MHTNLRVRSTGTFPCHPPHHPPHRHQHRTPLHPLIEVTSSWAGSILYTRPKSGVRRKPKI